MKTKKRKVCRKCSGEKTIYDPPEHLRNILMSEFETEKYIKTCPECGGTGERNKHMSEKYKVIKYGAAWCGPCKTVDNMLDQLSDDIEVVRLDIDDSEIQGSLVEKGVRAVPHTELYIDGDLVKTYTGVMSKEDIESVFAG